MTDFRQLAFQTLCERLYHEAKAIAVPKWISEEVKPRPLEIAIARQVAERRITVHQIASTFNVSLQCALQSVLDCAFSRDVPLNCCAISEEFAMSPDQLHTLYVFVSHYQSRNLDFLMKSCQFSVSQLEIFFAIFALGNDWQSLTAKFNRVMSSRSTSSSTCSRTDVNAAPGMLQILGLSKMSSSDMTSSKSSAPVACNDTVKLEGGEKSFRGGYHDMDKTIKKEGANETKQVVSKPSESLNETVKTKENESKLRRKNAVSIASRLRIRFRSRNHGRRPAKPLVKACCSKMIEEKCTHILSQLMECKVSLNNVAEDPVLGVALKKDENDSKIQSEPRSVDQNSGLSTSDSVWSSLRNNSSEAQAGPDENTSYVDHPSNQCNRNGALITDIAEEAALQPVGQKQRNVAPQLPVKDDSLLTWPSLEATFGSEALPNKHSNGERPGSRSRMTGGRHERAAVVDGEGRSPEQVIQCEVSLDDSVAAPAAYMTHRCCPRCLTLFDDPEDFRDAFPLVIPLLCGWRREKWRTTPESTQNGRISHVNVVYVGPCGRRMRSYANVVAYLRATNSALTPEFFSFDPKVRVLATISVENARLRIDDVACHMEAVPLQCVNAIDDDRPDENFCYRSLRFSTDPRIDLENARTFLSGCSCTDNCVNATTCECQQLTSEEAKITGMRNGARGYRFRHQSSPLATGIFECNRFCKCDRRCGNRLVQLPAFVHLQVFKTTRKGWGVRALHDIPKGCFISVYAGEVLSDHQANREGTVYGDEYFAELDLLKSFEEHKKGCEVESTSDSSGSDSSDVIFMSEIIRSYPKSPPWKKRRASSGEKCSNVDNTDVSVQQPKFWSFLKYFGSSLYTVNGKRCGNVGRFFNHSCTPNMFVQNVFVDTHDLRLPWVAFFASRRIQAGEELTWDYRYTPDSVPGKASPVVRNFANRLSLHPKLVNQSQTCNDTAEAGIMYHVLPGSRTSSEADGGTSEHATSRGSPLCWYRIPSRKHKAVQTMSIEAAELARVDFRLPLNRRLLQLRAHEANLQAMMKSASLSPHDLNKLRKRFDKSEEKKRQQANDARKAYRPPPGYFLISSNQSFNIASKIYATRAYSFADTEASRRRLASLVAFYPFLLPSRSKSQPRSYKSRSQRRAVADASVQCSVEEKKVQTRELRSISVKVDESTIAETDKADAKQQPENGSVSTNDRSCSDSEGYAEGLSEISDVTSFAVQVPEVEEEEADDEHKNSRELTSNSGDSEDGYASDFEVLSRSTSSHDRTERDVVDEYMASALGSEDTSVAHLVSRSVQVSEEVERYLGNSRTTFDTDEDLDASRSFEALSLTSHGPDASYAEEISTDSQLLAMAMQNGGGSFSGSVPSITTKTSSEHSICTVIDLSSSDGSNSNRSSEGPSSSSSLTTFGEGVRKLHARLHRLRERGDYAENGKETMSR